MGEICWNCKHFDSFACVCHVHGTGKDAIDTCNQFRKIPFKLHDKDVNKND